jgi:hypothetical protein
MGGRSIFFGGEEWTNRDTPSLSYVNFTKVIPAIRAM